MGTKLRSFAPHTVAACVEGYVSQTELSALVWGSSGRGSPSLTHVLFPWMAATGYLHVKTRGRRVSYMATPKGIEMCSAVTLAEWLCWVAT